MRRCILLPDSKGFLQVIELPSTLKRRKQSPLHSTALIWILAAQPLSAEQVPPLQYFVGEYLVIGRVAGSLADGMVVATENNERLQLKTDFLGNGWLALNDSQNELTAPLTGEIGNRDLFCLYTNDGDNYPIINCRLEIGGEHEFDGYLTLWPNG